MRNLIAWVLLFPLSGFGADDSIDLTGNWEIHSSVGGQVPITVNCDLIQTGNELSGSCTPVMEDPEAASLTGMITGATANWRYGVVFNGNAGTVEFQANIVTSDGMLGTLILSGTPAPFAALKR